VGTPAVSEQTLAPGAGHGDEGDASFQGPAQEQLNEPLPAQPKPTYAEVAIAADGPNTVIELNARSRKPKAMEPTAVAREAGGLVTTRPKPEKRKNAKERAKAKFAKAKDGKAKDANDEDKTAADGTTPMTATAKSEAETKARAERKAEGKVAAKAAKAERKAKRTAAKKAA
jgi:hypothetical protein